MNNILSPSTISSSKLLSFSELEYDDKLLGDCSELELTYEQKQSLLFSKEIFTTDWFSGNVGNWQRIFQIFDLTNENKIIKALELGSWEGRSTCFILNNLMKNKDSELIVCDTFNGSVEHIKGYELSSIYSRFSHNVTLTGKHKQLKVIRGSTLIEIPKMELTYNNYFNFMYIDASHTAKDVLIDSMNCFCLLAIGGIMIFDDYLWGDMSKYYECPKYGIDTFLNFYKEHIRILSIGYQVVIQKI